MSNSWYDTLTSAPALIATALGVSVAALFVSTHNNSNKTAAQVKEQVKEVAHSVHAEGSTGKMAQAEDPITPSELAKHDGSDPSKPIYVAIKGKVFDVSPRSEMYGPGKGYNVFAGKDGSKGLGMSSLDPTDAVADYSSLNESQMNTLNQWEAFFEKIQRGGAGRAVASVMQIIDVPDCSRLQWPCIQGPCRRAFYGGQPQPAYGAPPGQYPPGGEYYTSTPGKPPTPARHLLTLPSPACTANTSPATAWTTTPLPRKRATAAPASAQRPRVAASAPVAAAVSNAARLASVSRRWSRTVDRRAK
ncbi:hypothetical protein CNBM1080 [Cryptococcus deneoformans B-3501A]|uniref:hypothetical protein n=1 Tax=Cryptococcus deneoformans (strain B-3501A) TaxID=283643 RepID=UPI000042F47D|nr:hypothetical protein CNBM1080 [Cryptococcus neoformans var. neoformans B-3501A]EAL17542.1 hypothetical protein CNBM1080 [Cryptococcus neoformans var. neoformans B-3501A]